MVSRRAIVLANYRDGAKIKVKRMPSRWQDWKRWSAAQTRWLAPGLGVKRWLILLGLGVGVAGMGVVYLILVPWRGGWLPTWLWNAITLQFLPHWGRVIFPLALGGILILLAVNRLSAAVVAPFRRPDQPLLDGLYDYSQRQRGPHIVAIGGGTGLSALLRGLTAHTNNITAIVTVADDGGSSGRLRRELGMLPPGDFRNNMAALARDEALMTQLMQFRFVSRDGSNAAGQLHGHAFGNLLLAALTGITGSFEEGLLAAERVLSLRGRVLPSTLDEIRLVADVREPVTGEVRRIEGESAIPEARGRIIRLGIEPADARAFPRAVQAVFQADLLVMGPGSLYTSILPNLLIPGLAEAVRLARAPTVYICNLATQPGETDNYDVADHVAALTEHLPTGIIDMVLANNNLSVDPQQGGGQTQYVPVSEPPEGALILADLVDEAKPWRHDSDKLARTLMSLLARRN
jgi:uncharacterized cofD-like protein